MQRKELTPKQYFEENYSDYLLGKILFDGMLSISKRNFFDEADESHEYRTVGVYNNKQISAHLKKIIEKMTASQEKIAVYFYGVNWSLGLTFNPNAKQTEDAWTIIDTTSFPISIQNKIKTKKIKELTDLTAEKMSTAFRQSLDQDWLETQQAGIVPEVTMIAPVKSFKDSNKLINYLTKNFTDRIQAISHTVDRITDNHFSFETRVVAKSAKTLAPFETLDNDEEFKAPSQTQQATMRGVKANHLLARTAGIVDFTDRSWNKADKHGYTPLMVAIEHRTVNLSALIKSALNQKSQAGKIVVEIIQTANHYKGSFFYNHLHNELDSLLKAGQLSLDPILQAAAERGASNVLDFLVNIDRKMISKLPQEQNTNLAVTALKNGHADFFINLSHKIGLGQISLTPDAKGKTLYDYLSQVKNKKHKEEVKNILNQNLVDLLTTGAIQSKDFDKLSKYTKDVFELIKDDKNLVDKALQYDQTSRLHQFFDRQKGMLEKLHLQKLLFVLSDDTIDGQTMFENLKYRKDIFKLIENNFNLMSKAARQPQTRMYQFFHPKEKPNLFSKSLPKAIDSAYRKLEKKQPKKEVVADSHAKPKR